MKRIAIGIELDWPYEHHYDVVQGVLEYGREQNWECRLEPGLETTLDIKKLPSKYDGIIARANQSLVDCCKKEGVPLINVWTNSGFN